MSYKKYIWEVVATDYSSPFFRNHLAPHIFVRQSELLGTPRVAFGIASEKNAIEYIADLTTWVAAHKELRARVENDYRYLEELVELANGAGIELTEWSEREIFTADLTTKTSSELVELLEAFVPREETVYAYGIALVLLDFADFSFLETHLKKILERAEPEKRLGYFQLLTHPTQNSCAQDQEEALLRLMVRFYPDQAWSEAVCSSTAAELEERYPAFMEALCAHAKEYGWVYYVFTGPAFGVEHFLEFIRDHLLKNVDPGQKLHDLLAAKEKLLRDRAACLKLLNPTPFERGVIDLASLVVWAKPRRKDYQSKSYFHLEKLQRELGKRLALSLDQVRSTPIAIFKSAAEDNDVDVHHINEIYKRHVCVTNDDGSITVLVGQEAEEFAKAIKRSDGAQDFSGVKEIVGSVARPGLARGVVKIINAPSDMPKMQYGDVLVSRATAPSIVAAMKRASAIVTDEGGLTCHASIVSRELGIPCVVGAKIATLVFKDGDLVEVDANKGIIKRL